VVGNQGLERGRFLGGMGRLGWLRGLRVRAARAIMGRERRVGRVGRVRNFGRLGRARKAERIGTGEISETGEDK